MSAGEIRALLAYEKKVQIATLNRDGTAHLVTMFFGLTDGHLVFWTYRASQKACNLARDPRITCLVEDGDDYFTLRGVQISGVAEPIEDLTGVTAVGRLIAARMPDVPVEALDAYVARAAPKRTAYVVQPRRVASWDHRKLLG